MSPNRRIFLNIVATYGRSLYALVIGLLCGRWALMALGEVDFGLMGVVGALAVFISFLNGLLASAVGRFYAYTIGSSSRIGGAEIGLDECRKWFSLAVTLHTVLPVALMAIGYPLGVWAVKNYLVIPPDRIDACIWVFRFVCVSCFIAMVTIPYSAMYTAKQYIAEITIYSFITATLNVAFLYYMVSHSGVWLIKYAFWTCLLSVCPSVIIAYRAVLLFQECKFVRQYWWSVSRFKELLSYSAWTIVGGLGMIFRNQGIAILVNKFYGPNVNASMAIANSVNAQTTTLTGAIQGAMTPVITGAIGSGDLEKAKALAFRFCKLAMIFSLVFIVPLSLELPEVMRLWLKNPPVYVVGLCWIMLLMTFVDAQTHGHGIAVMAYGRIKWYQIVLGGFNLLALPMAYVFCKIGYSVYWVALAMLIAWSLLSYGRLYFAKKFLGMGVGCWLIQIMLPIIFSAAIATLVALLPRCYMGASFWRVVLTSATSTSVLLPLCWFFVLTHEEREYVVARIKVRFYNHG